jgi:hypothetical protein
MHGEWNSDPEKYRRWKGLDADLDPPGRPLPGAYEHPAHVLGEYVVVDPYPLVFAWGWEDSSELPPGSSTVEITLVPDGDGTLIRLRHTGLPSEESRAPARRGLEPLPGAPVAGGRRPRPRTRPARRAVVLEPRGARVERSQAASLAQEGKD